MKNISYNLLTNKNFIKMNKVHYINDINDNSKENQNQKRLLHFSLMKFIKTQYNKEKIMLMRKEKYKGFFTRCTNLNLLPFLKKKNNNNKNSEKKAYLSAHSKMTRYIDKRNYISKTNNINEYSSKRNTLELDFQERTYKNKKQREKKINKNRIKSSFDGEKIKFKDIFGLKAKSKDKLINNSLLEKSNIKKDSNILYLMSQDYNYIFPFHKRKNSSKSNSNIHINEDIKKENNKFTSRINTPIKDWSINYQKKFRVFTSKTSSKKIKNYIYNTKYENSEVNKQNINFETTRKNYEQFFNSKNKFINLNKNFTNEEENKDSKLDYISPYKNNSNNNTNIKNLDSSENKSLDKNKIINYIKFFDESRKNSSTEVKNDTSKNNLMTIKKHKFNLKETKNDYKNYYKNKYEIIRSFFNTKEGSKINKSEQKRKLINNKKREIIEKLHINTKFGQFNRNNIKMIQICPIAINRNIDNRKNNNNDIIDLI